MFILLKQILYINDKSKNKLSSKKICSCLKFISVKLLMGFNWISREFNLKFPVRTHLNSVEFGIEIFPVNSIFPI